MQALLRKCRSELGDAQRRHPLEPRLLPDERRRRKVTLLQERDEPLLVAENFLSVRRDPGPTAELVRGAQGFDPNTIARAPAPERRRRAPSIPPSRRAARHARAVAPVVTTSSTRITRFPEKGRLRANAPSVFSLRASRPRRACWCVSRRRSRRRGAKVAAAPIRQRPARRAPPDCSRARRDARGGAGPAPRRPPGRTPSAPSFGTSRRRERPGELRVTFELEATDRVRKRRRVAAGSDDRDVVDALECRRRHRGRMPRRTLLDSLGLSQRRAGLGASSPRTDRARRAESDGHAR